MTNPTITDLAAIITKNTAIYNDFLTETGLPSPSHTPIPPPGPPLQLPNEVAAALDAAKEATHELHMLLLNPVELVLSSVPDYSRIVALSFINRYQIAQKIGPDERKTFKVLADECGLDESDVRRMLRLAMTEHLFVEPESGVVAHTAASFMLVAVPGLDAWVWNFARNNFPAAAQLADTLGKWPGAEDPTPSAFCIARNLNEGYFEYLTKHPDEAKMFAKALEFVTASAPFGVAHFIKTYHFSSLPSNATFVDVGGSHGIVAIEVAKANLGWRCIVQDLSEPTISAARSNLASELEGRVDFVLYDFWMEQPIKGADIYFFRWIFHDWSDKYAVKLLKNVVPALKRGSRVVINDVCLPLPGVMTPYQERIVRSIDCVMKAFANAKEREEGEWRMLFAKADAGFKFQPIVQPPNSTYAIIEAIWDP